VSGNTLCYLCSFRNMLFYVASYLCSFLFQLYFLHRPIDILTSSCIGRWLPPSKASCAPAKERTLECTATWHSRHVASTSTIFNPWRQSYSYFVVFTRLIYNWVESRFVYTCKQPINTILRIIAARLQFSGSNCKLFASWYATISWKNMPTSHWCYIGLYYHRIGLASRKQNKIQTIHKFIIFFF